MGVRAVLARVFVDSLDRSLALYEALAGDDAPRRFSFGEIELASVGAFLLLAGSPERLRGVRDRVASVVVDDVDETAALITAAGGELIDGPSPGPNGPPLIARHPDGAVFEYLRIDDLAPPAVRVVARVRVAELDASLHLYERLAGVPAERFSFGGAQLASAGPFLVFAAGGELGDRFAQVTATVAVDDLDTLAGRLTALGAEIVAAAAPTPNGRRLIARHPDGAVFEYVSAAAPAG